MEVLRHCHLEAAGRGGAFLFSVQQCLKEETLAALDRMIRTDVIPLAAGVELVRQSPDSGSTRYGHSPRLARPFCPKFISHVILSPKTAFALPLRSPPMRVFTALLYACLFPLFELHAQPIVMQQVRRRSHNVTVPTNLPGFGL